MIVLNDEQVKRVQEIMVKIIDAWRDDLPYPPPFDAATHEQREIISLLAYALASSEDFNPDESVWS